MSEQLREALSAVIDGEAGEFELKRVLNELSTNDELRGLWDRYHLVRDVMRGERLAIAPRGLADRVWARIEADETTEAPTPMEPVARRAAVRWLGPVTAVAVAAAVAVSVVLGLRTDDGSTRGVPVIASSAPSLQNVAAPVAIEPVSPFPAYPSSRDMQRTHAYMLHHVQHTALNNQASVLPLAKVAAFEVR